MLVHQNRSRVVLSWVCWTFIAAVVGPLEGNDRSAAASEPAYSALELRALMRDLTDFVYEKHVVRDEQRPTFGMTYEFWREGRQIQDFGLDSLHDGAWFLDALLTAERADPAGDYLERAQRYQIPFYVNILRNSDRLFPLIRKTDEDRAELEQPARGRLPLAWDDGGGFDLNTGAQHEPRYNTHQGPNHLAQDVADALLNAWLSTHNPAAAEALLLLHQERLTNFGTVPPVAFAAGYTNQQPELTARSKPPQFKPDTMPGYSGLYQQNGEPLSAYDDPLGWQYGQAVAEAAQTGTMPEEFVVFAAARVHGYALTMELFYGDRPWPQGMHFFDIQGQPRFIAGEGRLDEYASTARKLMGGRGIQMAWVAAGILPELRRNPQLWERYYRQHHADEPLVRIVDTRPAVDGNRDDSYGPATALKSADSSVWLVGDPRGMSVLIESASDEVEFRIRHTGPSNGDAVAGVIHATNAGKMAVTNSRGNALEHEPAFAVGDRWRAELWIPYTVMPGQGQWINGVDHGRYSVTWADGKEQPIYLLSSPERIIKRLEAYVDGTIRTWQQIWQEMGIVPSGYPGTNLRSKHWEISDAGNYAHFIRLLGLRVIDSEGQREWEVVARQRPEQPLRSEPLPAATLQAQGL